ncbi:hypothetical protein KUTeg_013112 [Tegillarca granosa]|uniref:Uncharacterized protein n=1 Tax=Tegillarca granosa TaxID=220873 RepID=A0ABQ9ESR4_TEGGR|nr:hypothetical protein KUTeg_013112 [Tegillarca granosa]
MQSLIGSVNFACKVVSPGRTFCRRLINSTIGLSKPFHHIRISSELKADLRMWLLWVSNADIQHFTDSSAKFGNGFWVVFNGAWAFGVWPKFWFEKGFTKDITVLEFFPIVVSVYIWGIRRYHIDQTINQ